MDVKKSVLPILFLGLFLSGCQKMTMDAKNGLAGLDEGQALSSCANKAEKVDLNGLQIEGAATAQAGQHLKYTLNEDVSCVQNQKVVWKTLASSDLKIGSEMDSSFQKAGTYVVSALVEDELGSTKLSYKTLVVTDTAAISGPAYAMVGYSARFELAIPASMNVVSAAWNFGDNTAIINATSSISHTYNRPGQYNIAVELTEASGAKTTLTHRLDVLPIQDGLECVSELAISSPSEAVTGQPVSMSVYIPPCLTSTVTAINWSFGDNSSDAANQTVQHTYSSAGAYTITVDLYSGSDAKWATLTANINVKDPVVVPTPTPSPSPTPVVDPTPEVSPTPVVDPTPEVSPTPVVDPTPEVSPTPEATPTPTVTPSPTPVPNPMACAVPGATRDNQGELYAEEESCGNGGRRSVSYRDRVRERCDWEGEELLWRIISTDKEVQNRGPCKGEYCVLGDGSQLGSGETKTVVSGEVKVPLTCGFGEQGYFNTFTQLTDKSCKDGVLTDSNTRQGDLQNAGQCPTYNWVLTDSWTACSADCGGQQSRVSRCESNTGVVVGAEFCADKEMPQELRVCDGNPEAARRSEQLVSQEDGNSSKKCPSNQIGVVINERDVTTTRHYACIDHRVQFERETVAYSAWRTESYCRDFVAHRCSKDSLSTEKAEQRYKWMVKCQNEIPVIKDFLQQFEDVKVKNGKITLEIGEVNRNKQLLYPTFMNRATNPEKPWIAPTKASAACVAPATVYVAAVCVSSCATPEQQILVEVQKKKQMKYVTFIEALTQNYARVATLASADSMSNKTIMRTSVQQWVTELLDTNHVIIEFRMKSGGLLRLTPNHPVVAADGSMKLADDFKVGDSLVQLGGHLDEIVSANRVDYFGKVYNLFVNSSEIHKNIVITNGYLNGTAYFQNQGAQDMNRNLFKKKLTAGIFSK